MPTDDSQNPKVQRRLAAILAADIAGYSALMGADEARTVRDLKAHQAVILPMIGEHGGRIIDTAGDGILAEFGSVVNAVECAVAIQKTMADRNAIIEADRRMLFRIGISLGDVIHDEARVYGDGVNIAARLEGIAEPGGIRLSGDAFNQVSRKLSLTFTDLGEQQLKNIAQPVRVYRIDPAQRATSAPQPRVPLALPDKPSVAVLPFTNLSGDPKEDYFSDGITEDIITELSRFSELFVIARNSSFQYKGKSPISGRSAESSVSATCWKAASAVLATASASPHSSSMQPPAPTAGPSVTTENSKTSSPSKTKSRALSSRSSPRM